MEQHIVYEEDTYGTILLNRAKKRNAISLNMATRLSELLDGLQSAPPKFLVIKSAGDDIFCAGGDLNELHGELNEESAYNRLQPMREVLYKIALFPVPTICLLQGNALGGGCELATSCDIRIAKAGTKFGFIQSNLGILPSWGGGALLYEKVLPSFALQWLTEGSFFDAHHLQEKGWIHRIVFAEDWDEEEILTNYMSKSVEQLAFLKKQYIESLDVNNLPEKMAEESWQSAKLWPSPEHKLAVQRFINK